MNNKKRLKNKAIIMVCVGQKFIREKTKCVDYILIAFSLSYTLIINIFFFDCFAFLRSSLISSLHLGGPRPHFLWKFCCLLCTFYFNFFVLFFVNPFHLFLLYSLLKRRACIIDSNWTCQMNNSIFLLYGFSLLTGRPII